MWAVIGYNNFDYELFLVKIPEPTPSYVAWAIEQGMGHIDFAHGDYIDIRDLESEE